MNLKQPRGRPPKYSEAQREEALKIAIESVGLNGRVIGDMVGVPGWKVLEWLTEYQTAARGQSAGGK